MILDNPADYYNQLKRWRVLFVNLYVVNITFTILFLISGVICYLDHYTLCPLDSSIGLSMIGIACGIIFIVIILVLPFSLYRDDYDTYKSCVSRVYIAIIWSVICILIVATIALKFSNDITWYALFGSIIGIIFATAFTIISLFVRCPC